MKKKIIFSVALFLLISIIFAAPIFADTLVLKSGELVEGKIRGYVESSHYFLVGTIHKSEIYFLSDVETVNGMQADKWIEKDDKKFTALFNIFLMLVPFSIGFYCLFIAEAIPGVGHYSFGVGNIDDKARVMILFTWIIGMAVSLANRYLGWGIATVGTIFLLSLALNSD